MIAGKVPPDLLGRFVFPYLGARRPDVLERAGVGEDCAVLEFGEWACVLTCDPITGAQRHLGRLAVQIACNDLATTGADPVAIMLTLLLAEGASPADLAAVMQEAGEAAARLGVEIVGGHTEVTPGVDRTIAVVTGVGRIAKRELVTPKGARPGDAVILTKAAGIEGTSILATDLADRLRAAVHPELLRRAQAFIERTSVVPEGLIAARAGASAMHDVTEGGVLMGAWELAEAAGLGIELWADAVPVLPETGAICRALDLDPLALIGSGAMLIATADPARVLQALADAQIPAARIGTLQAGERTIRRNGTTAPLVPPARDELWRLLDASAL